ncbi:MAG TPA: Stk1 family PASTA domain-containing Ser/Thr kinase, partial [Candidatus Baltobacteraceae bacterium]|nr:Stk1 family PASTA domain-containing Ser/Thr kinase [Candidatus Baltobacteraceae bacterium]
MVERNLSERYRLEGRIGQGGMATVYAGMDTVLRRRVAIKILRPQFAEDEDFVRRFYTEAQHAAKLSHPNIVNIYDVGREGETYFIVMELVDGATLAEMIESDGRLPEPVAIDFAAQICNGLAYAHRQGLLHRDIKPANILVAKDDVVKISDFGIARAVTTQTVTITQPGMVMGSVFYISPEQAQGREMHETSDLYSLGVVLYQMLSGRLPYTGESPVTVALKHVSSPVPSLVHDEPDISPALSAIVRKLMQKEPESRFHSAMELATALRAAREHPLVTTPFDVPARDADPAPATIPNPKPRRSAAPDVSAVRRRRVEETESQAPRRFGAAAYAGFALAALLAVAAGYIFVARPSFLWGKPQAIAVENFVGKPVDDAEAKLTAAGLAFSVVSVASDVVPANRVVRQDPPPASKLAPHAVVQLFVSAGLPTVELIDLRQYSRADAERYLRNARLVPKVTQRFDKAPKDTVLSQQPPPNTKVAIRSDVALVVSKGERPVPLPDLVTLLVGDATTELTKLGLKLEVSERTPNDNIPADVIASQNPAAGAHVQPGSTVSVVVSAGPPQFPLPDFASSDAVDAAQKLQSLGLPVRYTYIVDPAQTGGTILHQDPPAGASVAKGATVTLSVVVPG